MNLYEIAELENRIDHIAEQNEGEIPEELIKELVEKQTESLIQVENLCKYVRHLEQFADTCKKEEERIKEKRQFAENRIQSIKRYMLPYVERQGKVEAGVFKISTRKSTSVIIEDFFNDPRFITIVQERKINKADIKKAINGGETIEGAHISGKKSVQIK